MMLIVEIKVKDYRNDLGKSFIHSIDNYQVPKAALRSSLSSGGGGMTSTGGVGGGGGGSRGTSPTFLL